MTEKTEYKEIVFYFLTHQVIFQYTNDSWNEIKKSLTNNDVISLGKHVFRVDNLQFVERR